VCTDSSWLGITLDEAANVRHGPRISTAASVVSVWVLPTDEELVIARHTLALAPTMARAQEKRWRRRQSTWLAPSYEMLG
jgi:hypothetical protein